MNLREVVGDGDARVCQYVECNGSGSSFVVVVKGGIKVFTAGTCQLHLEQILGFTPTFATLLGDSQIIGLLKAENNNVQKATSLVLWDSGSRGEAASILTKAVILSCRLSKHHIALVFDSCVKLYRHQPKMERVASYETSSNPHGLCCLGETYLVIPGRTPGHLQVITLSNREVNIVPAHSTALRAITMSPNEDLVATGSSSVSTVSMRHSTDAESRV